MSEQIPVPLCKDCAHYREVKGINCWIYYCHAPQLPIDRVRGGIARDLCYDQRGYSYEMNRTACGPEGRWFTPKPAPVEPHKKRFDLWPRGFARPD